MTANAATNDADTLAFYWAATDGDVRTVAELLMQGIEPNVADEDGETALHRVAINADTSPHYAETISLLLAHGADPNQRDNIDTGRTSLDAAYRVANASAARQLREAGAHLADLIEGADSDEVRGAELSLAVLMGNIDAVDALLDQGIRVNTRDRYGRTALHTAAYSGDAMMVDFLLSHGADVLAREDASNNKGNVYPQQGVMPLHLAAMEEHVEAVRTLLAHGADVNADGGSDDSFTPLQWSVFRVHARDKGKAHQTIQTLLDHGANPYACFDSTSGLPSALSVAAWVGEPEDLALLLAHPAWQVSTDALLDAMHAATLDNGHRNLPILWEAGQRLSPPLTLLGVLPYITGGGLRVLLEEVSGLDVNTRDNETGETLLLWVVRHAEEPTNPTTWEQAAYLAEHVLMLLQRGADVMAKDNQGHSALTVARARGLTLCTGYIQHAENLMLP
jgi:ankyrin repeat protein